MKGLISSIQRYSLRDGPGIRSTVFLMGCNLHCLWCSNPELISPNPKVMVFPQKCSGCGACLRIDDDHALILEEKHLTFDASKRLDQFISVCPERVFERVGTEIEAAQLAQELLRDQLFYKHSGGGVTFSGGEPLLQSAFIKETALILKAQEITVAIDTAGMIDPGVFEDLDPVVDLYLYDLKALDEKAHRAYTGQSNALILSNFDRLIRSGKHVIVRMVIVPGINTSADEFAARLDYLNTYRGKAIRIDLLAYHRLGVGKYAALGEPYQLSAIPPLDRSQLERFAADLSVMGFDVHIEQAT